ncbi:phage holin family protein [Aestuariimicrobium ganziense]|uniref:phage holin family protein n=1 Tax=Aestuariimicrobium ganziense TaxID=2773677 RepID=UPI001942E33B|nr:phage holin family protein [Aestuariimicrobium ganziense]
MPNTSQVASIVDRIKTDGARIATDLKALAQAEVKPAVAHAGKGGGMFGAAGYLALNAVSLLFLAGAGAFTLLWSGPVGLGMVLSVVLGLISMALVLLVIAAVLAVVGKKEIDQVKAPEATIAEAKATVAALKTSAAEGKTVVTNNALAAKTIRQARRALD